MIPEKLPIYTFIKDIPEGMVYFCRVSCTMLVTDLKKMYYDPEGDASIQFDPVDEFVCAIKKIDGKIHFLREGGYTHSPYLSTSASVQARIIEWGCYSDTDTTFELNDPKEYHPVQYDHMSLPTLARFLINWLVMCCDQDRDPKSNMHIRKITKTIQKRVEECNDIITLQLLWENFESNASSESITVKDCSDILEGLSKFTSERLMDISEDPLYAAEAYSDLSIYSPQELEEMLTTITTSKEPDYELAIRLRNEMKSRNAETTQ